MAISKDIPTYFGVVPNKNTQTPSEFSANADDLLPWLAELPPAIDEWSDQANALGDNVNSLRDETEAIKNTAIDETEALKTEATTAATNANNSASEACECEEDAQVAATSAATQAANIGSMLGINFGGWVIENGELTVTHLTTTTPSIVDGELTLTYETL